MDTRIQKKKVLIETLLFFVKLNAFLLPFYAIIYFNWSYTPLQIVFAGIIASVIRFFGFEVFQSGFFLFLGKDSFPIDISFDCIGWKSSYSLFALLMATPGKIKQKLYFLVKWIPLLMVVNFSRVIIIILIGYAFGFGWIYPVHTYLFQPLMILIVIGIWFIWMKKEKIYRKKN